MGPLRYRKQEPPHTAHGDLLKPVPAPAFLRARQQAWSKYFFQPGVSDITTAMSRMMATSLLKLLSPCDQHRHGCTLSCQCPAEARILPTAILASSHLRPAPPPTPTSAPQLWAALWERRTWLADHYHTRRPTATRTLGALSARVMPAEWPVVAFWDAQVRQRLRASCRALWRAIRPGTASSPRLPVQLPRSLPRGPV